MKNIPMKWETYGQELKRCPFCGHKARIEKYLTMGIDEQYNFTIPMDYYKVICVGEESCGIEFMRGSKTPEEVAERWNSRTTKKKERHAMYSWNPDYVAWREAQSKKDKK